MHGKNNAVFSLLSNDLGTLLYSTYMGGQGTNLRANAFGPDLSIWVAGHSPGPEWPLKNAYPNACKAGWCWRSSCREASGRWNPIAGPGKGL